VGSVSGNLVPQPFRGDDSNLIADPLVGLEVEGELGVVTFNDDLGGLLDRLGPNATHFDGFVVVVEVGGVDVRYWVLSFR